MGRCKWRFIYGFDGNEQGDGQGKILNGLDREKYGDGNGAMRRIIIDVLEGVK